MPHAKLTVEIPQHTWIGDISTKHQDISLEVVTAMPGEETGIGLVRLDAADPLPIITDIKDRDGIDDLELLWKHEDEALLQIQTSNPFLLLPVLRAGVPLTTPFVIRDGSATWELTTTTSRLSHLRSLLEDFGIPFEIEYIRDIDATQADHLMTERQQEVLLKAASEGYYRSPREVTLGEVADTLEIANATCSDILHRAEGHIIHWFIEEHMEDSPSTGISL